MLLWANNGDIISRQYAGTNALKVRMAKLDQLLIWIFCHRAKRIFDRQRTIYENSS